MGWMGMGVVMQHNTPHEHANTLSLDDNIKVSKGSTTALCIDG
jgi:hypothetical protein